MEETEARASVQLVSFPLTPHTPRTALHRTAYHHLPKAGVGGVIKGWDQGCLGMKLGEVRELLIPAAEGLANMHTGPPRPPT